MKHLVIYQRPTEAVFCALTTPDGAGGGMRRSIAACFVLGVCALGVSACDDDDGWRRGYYGPPPPVVVQTPAPAVQAPGYAPPPPYYAPPPVYYAAPGYYGRGEDD